MYLTLFGFSRITNEILDITGYWMILASEKAINLIAISGSTEPLTR